MLISTGGNDTTVIQWKIVHGDTKWVRQIYKQTNKYYYCYKTMQL
jgi:hypothetical protein